MLPVVEQATHGGSPAQAALFRIEGGNDRLVDALVQSLHGKLLLQHELVTIAHAPDRVVDTVSDSRGEQQQLEADAIVVTLPVSTLRDVTIAPALAGEEQPAGASSIAP